MRESAPISPNWDSSSEKRGSCELLAANSHQLWDESTSPVKGSKEGTL